MAVVEQSPVWHHQEFKLRGDLLEGIAGVSETLENLAARHKLLEIWKIGYSLEQRTAVIRCGFSDDPHASPHLSNSWKFYLDSFRDELAAWLPKNKKQ